MVSNSLFCFCCIIPNLSLSLYYSLLIRFSTEDLSVNCNSFAVARWSKNSSWIPSHKNCISNRMDRMEYGIIIITFTSSNKWITSLFLHPAIHHGVASKSNFAQCTITKSPTYLLLLQTQIGNNCRMSFVSSSWLGNLLSFGPQNEREERLMNIKIEQSVIFDFHIRW